MSRGGLPATWPSKELPKDVHTSVPCLPGHYAVGKEYDGQIGHRYSTMDVTKRIRSWPHPNALLSWSRHDMMSPLRGTAG